AGPDLRGTGAGTQAGADAATVQAVRKAGGGTPLRLRDGAVAAEATPSDPEPVEGRWLPAEPTWALVPRPRLAFTSAALARAAAAPAQAQAARAAVRELAAAAGSDPGSAAAAWAFLALAEDDAEAVDRSAAAAVRATNGVPSPRRLAGIALAYDALSDRWPADTAAAINGWLRSQAAMILTGAPGRKAAPLIATDPIAAAERAAAGLAALAVAGDPSPDGGADPDPEPALRAVRRFLEQGVGARGAGPGHGGFPVALETIIPFVVAARHAGRDPGRGTGLAQVPMLALVSDGLLLDPAGGWFGLAGAVAEPRAVGLVRERLAGWRPADPAVAALALTVWPSADPVAALPPAWADPAAGVWVLRGPVPAAAVLTVEAAALATPGHARAGAIALRAFGRTWIHRAAAAAGWPARGRQSTVVIEEGTLRAQRPMVPLVGGAPGQVRLDGPTASMSVYTGPLVEAAALGRAALPEDQGEHERIVGWDTTGGAGAPVVVVVADRVGGIGTRMPVWQADAGSLPADRAVVGDGWIELRPAGAAESMRLTAVEPAGAWIEYRPPAGGAGGMVRILPHRPALREADLMDPEQAGAAGDPEALHDELTGRAAAPRPAAPPAHAGEADGDIGGGFQGRFVVVISIGPGPHPEPRRGGPDPFLPGKGRSMVPGSPLTIGRRIVTCDYHAIGFRDAP
ncbi:MAG: hypothetical protein RLZZ127_1, partial [Planctomycetota bacterium]